MHIVQKGEKDKQGIDKNIPGVHLQQGEKGGEEEVKEAGPSGGGSASDNTGGGEGEVPFPGGGGGGWGR